MGVVGLVVAGIQSDLGSTGVIVLMIATMAFMAGLPFKRILLIGARRRRRPGAGSSVPHHTDATGCRPICTLKRMSDDGGYQACQALIAVGSGGMIGLGLGRSVQANGYLPEAANDSIFAIYAEVFGFIGVVVLLGIYMALFSRSEEYRRAGPG